MIDKNILRNKYREIRKNIKSKEKKDNKIFKLLISLPEINKADLILIYASNDEEISTREIIDFYMGKKRIACPKVVGDDIIFYEITDKSQLQSGCFDILEPICDLKIEKSDFKNSICVVPAICFDLNGFRIGYGKGFYDRFLKDYDGYSIGLCYKECLIDKIPNDEFDIKVQKVITD
jgi:5-formyltetrahydrofolate cyclo-ligase